MPDPIGTVVQVSGLIGESSDFFRLPLKNNDHLVLDLEKATYMNSVGVKNWILWTAKVPSQATVTLKNCPFLIANQASIVVGFLPKNFKIDSFFAPFICTECEAETMVPLKRGTHFEYKSDLGAAWHTLPELKCSKCASGPKLDADFFPEKIFKFLS